MTAKNRAIQWGLPLLILLLMGGLWPASWAMAEPPDPFIVNTRRPPKTGG